MKFELVDDVRDAWKWASMRGMALAVTIIGGWEALSDDLKSYLPHWVGTAVALLVLVIIGMGGRVLKQDITGAKSNG